MSFGICSKPEFSKKTSYGLFHVPALGCLITSAAQLDSSIPNGLDNKLHSVPLLSEDKTPDHPLTLHLPTRQNRQMPVVHGWFLQPRPVCYLAMPSGMSSLENVHVPCRNPIPAPGLYREITCNSSPKRFSLETGAYFGCARLRPHTPQASDGCVLPAHLNIQIHGHCFTSKTPPDHYPSSCKDHAPRICGARTSALVRAAQHSVSSSPTSLTHARHNRIATSSFDSLPLYCKMLKLRYGELGLGLLPPPVHSSYAIDPIMFMINECMVISSAMRKSSRWGQGGVAAILGQADIFGEEDSFFLNLGLSALISLPRLSSLSSAQSNPLHSSFLQLRSILSEATHIDDVDALTLLQPFLLTIESSSTLGSVTALALNTILKLLQYEIISFRSKVSPNAIIQLTTSLTHCRFEASDQNTDDSVLLKVLRLLETIVVSPLSALLPNAVVSEVIHTCLSLACNKRRSEVLRRAAEMAMVAMTVKIFLRVRELEPESSTGDDIPTYTALHPDVMGDETVALDLASLHITQDPDALIALATIDITPVSPRKPEATDSPDQFDIQCINEFLGLLISMCSPTNQYQHMESTRVFALSLINIAVEVAGDTIPDHPSLMALIADPVSKDVLQIISSTESHALLQASLRLFCCMAVILNSHLKLQLELTFQLLFKSILPTFDTSLEGNTTIKGGNGSSRSPASKELIVESISFLWTRSQLFFVELFKDFDCDFEKSDLATSFVTFLCELALPESALITTDTVPPICLEGVLALISGVNERTKAYNPSAEVHSLITDKVQKNSFIKCTETFNENPKKGLVALCDQKFIQDPSDNAEVAKFFFQKSIRLNKKVLGDFLAKPTNIDILKEFLSLFDFGGLRVDEGLRLILKSFRLPGESQQIERIVELFAEAYVSSQTKENSVVPEDVEDKEPVLPDRDAVFILSYSIIMLNTDLHNPQVKKSMEFDAYRKNLKGVYNGKDFPEWYIAGIYNSIRDREIIMPEEHHGTEKWFDDVWHNLISSQTKYVTDHKSSRDTFGQATLCQFDKLLFESVVEQVVGTLIQVFNEASDDNIITKLMSSIDKCANICIVYNLENAITKLITQLAAMSTLLDRKYLHILEDEHLRQEIPITQIRVGKSHEPITVSEISVHYGRDFKAQLSTVVLFRLIKRPACVITDSWNEVLKIILNLFESCLIDPNLFSEFQKKLKLAPLARVKPTFEIQTAKPLKESGILSTFSSFLKSYSDEPTPPTDQEVESTISTLDCIKSVNIPGVFDIVSKADKLQMTVFVKLLLQNLPTFSAETRRFYETKCMFIFETVVCFTLIIDQEDTTKVVLSKITEHLKLLQTSSKGYIRLVTYYYLLIRRSHHVNNEAVQATFLRLVSFETDTLVSHGASLIQPLFSLVDHDSPSKDLLTDDGYWKVMRVLGQIEEFAPEILCFAESIITNSCEDITEQNYMSFLGLLDEISSLGASGAAYERGTLGPDEAAKNKAEVSVSLSKKSIRLTGDLSVKHGRQSYPLLQALAHQCFNPCRDVRATAIHVLQKTILSSEFSTEYTADGVFNFGLFPLLAELEKDEVIRTDGDGFPETHLQVLSLVSKAMLQFHQSIHSIMDTWVGIMDHFVILNRRSPVIKEPSLEVLKNMILVLRDESSFPDEFWTTTWDSLGKMFPALATELQDLVKPEEKELVKPNVQEQNVQNVTVQEDEDKELVHQENDLSENVKKEENLPVSENLVIPENLTEHEENKESIKQTLES